MVGRHPSSWQVSFCNEQKIGDLQKLLESSDSKKEMLALIDELGVDALQDIEKLDDILKSIPLQVENIEKTLK